MSTALETIAKAMTDEEFKAAFGRPPRAIALQKWNLEKLQRSADEAWKEITDHGAANPDELEAMVLAGDEKAMKLWDHYEVATAYQQVAQELMPLIMEDRVTGIDAKKGSSELVELGAAVQNLLWPVRNQADQFGALGRLAMKADEAVLGYP